MQSSSAEAKHFRALSLTVAKVEARADDVNCKLQSGGKCKVYRPLVLTFSRTTTAAAQMAGAGTAADGCASRRRRAADLGTAALP